MSVIELPIGKTEIAVEIAGVEYRVGTDGGSV
jgi:hypothetical protein